MEKENKLKFFRRITKTLLFFMYILILASLLFLETWARFYGTGYTIATLIYWIFLLGWVGLIINYKLKSTTSYFLGFILLPFVIALTVISIRNIAEVFMRIVFVFFLVGMIQALIEYKQNEKGSKNAKVTKK